MSAGEYMLRCWERVFIVEIGWVCYVIMVFGRRNRSG